MRCRLTLVEYRDLVRDQGKKLDRPSIRMGVRNGETK